VLVVMSRIERNDRIQPLLFSVETGRELGGGKPLEQNQDLRYERRVYFHSLL
jgi:hypothetical protein